MGNDNIIRKYVGTAVWKLAKAGVFDFMSDEDYLKFIFKVRLGRNLHLDKPTGYNEKMQWLKLHDRKDHYWRMVDKFEAKNYVADIIGDEYIIPTLGVWDRFEDIDFDKLPDQFVLKCTHDSGGLYICTDKSRMDRDKVGKKLTKALNTTFYKGGREWAYKNVKPRIIAEKYIVESDSGDLKDYKIFMYDGEPRFIQLDYDRHTNHKRNLYTPQWELLDAGYKYPSGRERKVDPPDKFDEMLELARKLSKDMIHARIDFYYVDGHIYFGEITLYHGSGFVISDPPSFEQQMGDWMHLPI